MTFFHDSKKKILFTGHYILTLIKYASCSSIQGLYFLNIFIYRRYYLYLFVKFNLDASLYKIKSHWLYILGGWHLNWWVKRWFIAELHCQTPFRKFIHIVCTRCCKILLWIVFWKLFYVQLSGWHTISIDKYISLWKISFWRFFLSCIVNAKSFLADSIQNRFIKVYNRGRNWQLLRKA